MPGELRCFSCSGNNIEADVCYPQMETRSLHLCCDCRCRFFHFLNEELEHGYFEDYWAEGVNEKIYSNPAVEKDLTKKYLPFVRNAMRKVPNNRLLDVGSGNGIFLKAISTLDIDGYGIEPSPKGVEIARKQTDAEIACGLLGEVDTLPSDFGIITAWDVIEHVIDPGRFIVECSNHMEDEGLLLLETPMEDCLTRRVVRFISSVNERLNKFMHRIYYPSHRQYFTREGICKLLAMNGFGEIETYTAKTPVTKSYLKLKLFYKPNKLKLLWLSTLFSLFKFSPPIFNNKLIVMAVKKPR